MNVYLSLGNGPKLFVEFTDRDDTNRGGAGRGLHVAREGGELLVWFGRLHLIYTPRGWHPPARGPTTGGPLPGGHGGYGDTLEGRRHQGRRLRLVDSSEKLAA